MRGVSAMVAAGLAMLIAGCDPTMERRYITEGAGVDLYTPDRAAQVALLDEYEQFICGEIGRGCAGSDWGTFVQAGMNDIDLRCDGFLTWLDAQRRDKEPILAEISAINTAAHAIMTVTGSSPQSLDIVTAAFGLASASYANWNSRLLIAVNQSTVQEIVYKSQGDYRDKIKVYPVPDRATAIYLLRNYLRLCMPITIEASINTTTTLVLRDAPTAARKNLVVSTVVSGRPGIIADANRAMTRFEPAPLPQNANMLPGERALSRKDMRFVLNILCRPSTESGLGPDGSPARAALAKFLAENGKRFSGKLDTNTFLELEDLHDANKRAC